MFSENEIINHYITFILPITSIGNFSFSGEDEVSSLKIDDCINPVPNDADK